MHKITNPHDKFFKEVMSHIEIARDFLMQYLPPEKARPLDFETLSAEKDSHIGEDLRELFSDLIFRVKLRNEETDAYVLFEHKSAIDKPVGLQLLKYMTAIWGKALSLDPSSPLPIIIPIVFYHGNRKWTISTDFDGLFETGKEHYGAYRRQIPSYEYLLYDFSSTKHEPIRGTQKLRIFLGITRAIFEEEKEVFIETVLDAMKVFDELRGTVGNEEYFEAYIRYLFYARTDLEQEELKERIKTVSMERSEKMLTIAEKLLQEGVEKGLAKGIKKGREEGRKEGREKGREEGREELLWKQITKKFPQIPERYYEKLKALTIDQLDTLGLDLIDMQNEEELKKHLPM